MSELDDFYNIILSLKRTDFNTQSQQVLFEIPAVMYPADPGQNLVLPLGPGSSEYPTIMTLYDIVTDGKDVYPNMVFPIVGDELQTVAIDDIDEDLNGNWRVIADPQTWNGGPNLNAMNSRVLKVVRVAAS